MEQEEGLPKPEGLPKVPLVGTSPRKDATKDPNAKHYSVVLRAGAGQQVLTFSMDNDTSASVAAMFLAMQYFPHVHTVEIYRKGGPDPNVTSDVGVGICMVPMSQLLKYAAPHMEELTGFVPPVMADLVTRIDRGGQGTEDLAGRVSETPRGGQGGGGR